MYWVNSSSTFMLNYISKLCVHCDGPAAPIIELLHAAAVGSPMLLSVFMTHLPRYVLSPARLGFFSAASVYGVFYSGFRLN